MKCWLATSSTAHCQIYGIIVVETKPIPFFLEAYVDQPVSAAMKIFSFYMWMFKGALDPGLEEAPTDAVEFYCRMKEVALRLAEEDREEVERARV